MASSDPLTVDCVVLGGGVVGLSVARELCQRGLRVAIIDANDFGKAASWAGAGILPPPPGLRADHPLDDLARRSHELHPQWADELRQSTGIDNGYRKCGGLYLARRPGEMASLLATVEAWRDEGLEPYALDHQQLETIEPGLVQKPAAQEILAAFWMPQESQLRNPRHLQALQQDCLDRGAALFARQPLRQLIKQNTSWRIETDRYSLVAATVCVCGGAWTAQLLQPFGVELNVVPIRGQMRLYQLESPPLRTIVNEGPRYLVPRLDGLVLAGATEEEAGFDASTTDAGLMGLQSFAEGWVPELTNENCVQSWAGLRPGTIDGFPYLGSIPAQPGLFVAAGHFRSGLYLSPATAEVMADLITGSSPSIDMSPFRVQRGLHRTGV